MMNSDLEAQYQQALEKLSSLVQQRNELLLRLETLSTLPLSISPKSGHVAEFELDAAHRLLDRVERQTVRIQEAMEKVNRYADDCGLPKVEWLKMPPSQAEAAAVEG